MQAGSGVTALGLLTVVALQAGGPAVPDTLGPAEQPRPAPATSAAADEPELVPEVVPSPDGRTGVVSVPGRGRGPQPQDPQQDPPTPRAAESGSSSSARPAQPAPATGPYGEVRRAYVTDGAPDRCGGSFPKVTVAGRVVNPSCSSATVTADGNRQIFGVDVCVSDQESAPVTLRFPTEREVAWTVSDGTDDVWTWGRGSRARAAAHEVVVRPGDCLTWRTTWTGVGDDGRALESNRYTLRVQLLSTDDRYRFQKDFDL